MFQVVCHFWQSMYIFWTLCYWDKIELKPGFLIITRSHRKSQWVAMSQLFFQFQFSFIDPSTSVSHKEFQSLWLEKWSPYDCKRSQQTLFCVKFHVKFWGWWRWTEAEIGLIPKAIDLHRVAKIVNNSFQYLQWIAMSCNESYEGQWVAVSCREREFLSLQLLVVIANARSSKQLFKPLSIWLRRVASKVNHFYCNSPWLGCKSLRLYRNQALLSILLELCVIDIHHSLVMCRLW